MACALWPVRTWLPLIRRLRYQGLTLSADIGWNPRVFRSPELPRLLRELDFAFPNQIEARAITGEQATERALKKLAEWVRVPVIKLGARGSMAIQDGKVVRVKPMRGIAVRLFPG